MANQTSGRVMAILVIAFFGATGHAFAHPAAGGHQIGKAADALLSLAAFGRWRGGGNFGYVQRRQPRHAGSPARSFLRGRASRVRGIHLSETGTARLPRWRRPAGTRQSTTSNEPAYPPRLSPRGGGSGRNNLPPPRYPGSFDIWRQFRTPAPAPTAALIPPAVAAIAGFGGSRPPIAPHFSRNQGQSAPAAVAALLNHKRHRAKEILIEVPNGSADQLRQALLDQYGVEIRELGDIQLINARIWRLTLVRGQDLGAVLGQLLQDNRVISAQPNYVYTPLEGTNERSSADRKRAPAAPPAEGLPTGAGVTVAIIDTCVDRNHTEIEGSVQSFFDATASQSKVCATENHGTAVASLIRGHKQIHGSASRASLMEARAFAVTEEEKEVAATSQEIALALSWAASEGARVVNLSFAGPSDPLVERVVAATYTKGIVLVGAAGNAGPSSPPLYPAAYPEVIAVTATDAKRELYTAANRGSHIAVSARGVDVLVAHVNNGYGTESGTSFAAATVSGIAAGLVQMRPKAKPDEIRAALQNTAVSSAKEKNELFGYGLVDAKAAAAFINSRVSQ